MKDKVLCACALVFLAAGAARGQQPDQDPIGQNFFAPELVMQHQEAIGLNEEQKTDLKAEIRQAQLKFTEWQWKLQDEMEKLANLHCKISPLARVSDEFLTHHTNPYIRVFDALAASPNALPPHSVIA